MPNDARDGLWETVFNTYYQSYYVELLEDSLATAWQKVDAITKILVAVTASGSAISGWALWSEQSFKDVWTVLATIAALLSVIHSSLDVPGIINDHNESMRRFISLTTKLENLRDKMRLNPKFPVADIMKEHFDLRAELSSNRQLLKNDLLRTAKRAMQVQERLNAKLKPEIQI